MQAKDGPDADNEAVGMVQSLKDAGKLKAFGTGRQAGLTCSVLVPDISAGCEQLHLCAEL